MPAVGGGLAGWMIAGLSDRVHAVMDGSGTVFAVLSVPVDIRVPLGVVLGGMVAMAVWVRGVDLGVSAIRDSGRARAQPGSDVQIARSPTAGREIIAWTRRVTVAFLPLLLCGLGLLRYSTWCYENLGILYVLGSSLSPCVLVVALMGCLSLRPNVPGEKEMAPWLRSIDRWKAWRPLWGRRLLAGSGWRLGAAVFAVFALAALPWAEKTACSGDEPHYLIITYSLLHDGDINLRNNYAQGDIARWMGRDSKPHVIGRGPRREMFSVHSPGLPITLIPGVLVGGRLGDAAGERLGAMINQQVWTALLAVSLFRLGRRWLRSRRRAAGLVALTLVTMPWLTYALTLYTEVPAAAMVAYLLDMVAARALPPGAIARAMLAIAFLPWLHIKYYGVAAVAGAVLLLRVLWARGWRGAALYAVGSVLLAQGVPLYNFATAGDYGLLSAYRGGASPELAGIWGRMLGQLVDRQYGFALYAPYLLIGFLGLAGRCARRRGMAIAASAALLVHWPLVSSYEFWWGGGPYPNRFMLPVAPLLALGAAAAWVDYPSRIFRFVLGLAMFFSVAIGLLAFSEPVLVLQRNHGISQLFSHHRGGMLDFADFLPSFVVPAATLWEQVGWLTVLLAGLVGTARLCRAIAGRCEPGRLGVAVAVGMVLPLTLLAGFGRLVDPLRLAPLSDSETWMRIRGQNLSDYIERAESAGYRMRIIAPAALAGAALPWPQLRVVPGPQVQGGAEVTDRLTGARVIELGGQQKVIFAVRERLGSGTFEAQFRLRSEALSGEVLCSVIDARTGAALSRLVLPTRSLPDSFRTVTMQFESTTPVGKLALVVEVDGPENELVQVAWAAVVPPLRAAS
ncbi:MAG: hypothetical protein HYV63_15060 [Candidatus Schekmanbacteria bacterium]|nr:hypothetical protein [Candidatus Schekmanbacteria bacterium]